MHELPFCVGDLAESRSFQVGFRGAWFRCKIIKIRKKNGVLAYLMEYIDYPDQKTEWIKVYQKPLAPSKSNKSKSIKRELMVRPCFPTFYVESEKPDASTTSGEIIIVDNAWKVGDLVDWWTDGCYWSGRVTKILENGEVKIDLLPPPMGEGLTYEAFSKDIRPSLDWCPDKGWTVPIPMLVSGGKQHPCARLIKPEHSEDVLNTNAANGIAKVVQTSTSASFECSSFSSQNTDELGTLEKSIAVSNTKDKMELDVVCTSIRKTSSSDSASSSHISAMGAKNDGHVQKNSPKKMKKDKSIYLDVQKNSPKKMKKDKSIYLDSTFLSTIEGRIVDLEELVNRVKWIRGIMEFGIPMSSTNRTFWEFWQHDAPCMYS